MSRPQIDTVTFEPGLTEDPATGMQLPFIRIRAGGHVSPGERILHAQRAAAALRGAARGRLWEIVIYERLNRWAVVLHLDEGSPSEVRSAQAIVRTVAEALR